MSAFTQPQGKLMDINEQFSDIWSSLESLHTKQDSLYRELLGNGQPGRIQRLEEALGDNAKAMVMFAEWRAKQDEKITNLEGDVAEHRSDMKAVRNRFIYSICAAVVGLVSLAASVYCALLHSK